MKEGCFLELLAEKLCLVWALASDFMMLIKWSVSRGGFVKFRIRIVDWDSFVGVIARLRLNLL